MSLTRCFQTCSGFTTCRESAVSLLFLALRETRALVETGMTQTTNSVWRAVPVSAFQRVNV